jgi:predicted PurR-regulated permease PerM
MGEAPRSKEESFTKKAVIASAVAAVAAIGVWMLFQVVHVLLLTFAGVLAAVLLWHLARELSDRTPLSIRASLLVVVAAIFSALGAVGILVGPSLFREFEHLVEAVPFAWESLQQEILKLPWGDRVLSMATTSPELAENAAAQVTTGISRAIAAVVYTFVVVFVGIYVAYAPDVHWNGLMHLLPPEERPRAKEILLDIRDNLWWWGLGRGFSMALVGISTALGLFILGVPSAGALGVLAGALDFIPNFGPVLAVIAALLMAMPLGTRMMFFVAILYVGIQVVEWTCSRLSSTKTPFRFPRHWSSFLRCLRGCSSVSSALFWPRLSP